MFMFEFVQKMAAVSHRQSVVNVEKFVARLGSPSMGVPVAPQAVPAVDGMGVDEWHSICPVSGHDRRMFPLATA